MYRKLILKHVSRVSIFAVDIVSIFYNSTHLPCAVCDASKGACFSSRIAKDEKERGKARILGPNVVQ